MNKDDILFIYDKALMRAAAFLGYDLKPLLKHKPNVIDVFGMAVRDLMARQPDIFFLQIGAHDGLTKDPIAPLVRQHHWRGLLVEPQKQVFAQLIKNYG